MWYIQVNAHLWDLEGVKERVRATGPLQIPFSKGRAHMKKVPVPGDSVVIISGGKKHLKGVVVEGFSDGHDHQRDPFNCGSERPHEVPPQFAVVALTEVDESPDVVPSKTQDMELGESVETSQKVRSSISINSKKIDPCNILSLLCTCAGFLLLSANKKRQFSPKRNH